MDSTMKNVIVFSIALNGYQWRYKSLLASHDNYAKGNGYQYVAVTQPAISLLGVEVAWLKVKLILEAMNAGYDWVVFFDADTRVAEYTPPIHELADINKHLYACKGYSGRLNSGVLIIENNQYTYHLFLIIFNNATSPVPKEDDVGWGENGHIIHYTKQCNFLAFIDKRWNNNHNPTLNDYIRHYSQGPLHNDFKPPFIHHCLERSYHYLVAALKRIRPFNQKYLKHGKGPDKGQFYHQLNALTQKVLRHYPLFKRIPQTNLRPIRTQ